MASRDLCSGAIPSLTPCPQCLNPVRPFPSLPPPTQLLDEYGKSGAVQWGHPIPPLYEVLRANLQYDMADAKRIKEGTLGCPKSTELKA